MSKSRLCKVSGSAHEITVFIKILEFHKIGMWEIFFGDTIRTFLSISRLCKVSGSAHEITIFIKIFVPCDRYVGNIFRKYNKEFSVKIKIV